MLPDPAALAVFLIATLSLNITPGPDMHYVIARSIGQGRTAGMVSALGIGAGTFVHTFAVAFGLAALIAQVPLAYEIVKYAGATYLVYLGVRTLASRGGEHERQQLKSAGMARIFGQGVVTNVLNPKVALFFLAFLPQFTSTARGPVAWQLLTLGVIFNISGTSVNTGVALVSGYVGGKLRSRPLFSRIQRWLTGGIFIGLAVRLALLEKK